MITREVLNAQRELYIKGREKAATAVAAFGGAIECVDNLLVLLDQADAAQPTEDFSAVMMTAEENTNA